MKNKLPLLLEPQELAKALPAEEILVIAVCSEKVFGEGHLPGAILVTPGELVCGIKPATGKLPGKSQLDGLFSRIGLSSEKHIVAYDDEGGGWAGRLLWTLDVVGHSSYSLLNGGQIAWQGANLPMTKEVHTPQTTSFNSSVNNNYIATMSEVLTSIEDDNVIVWDARSKEEYDGVKVTAQKNGHIPGAVNLDWLEVMDRTNNLKLKPLDVLREELNSLGITEQKNVITHCQTHHRSGLTYIAGKILGMNIKAYDGSWSEWGNHEETPIET